MRYCFRPFRLFLSSIGRFPYKVVKEKSKREQLATIEENIKDKNRKGSNFPLLQGFVNQVYKVLPCFGQGIVLISTLFYISALSLFIGFRKLGKIHTKADIYHRHNIRYSNTEYLLATRNQPYVPEIVRVAEKPNFAATRRVKIAS
jgi:hypothetical protein